jgi:hypothetical protein
MNNKEKESIEKFLERIPQLKEYVVDIDLEEYHKSDDKSYIYEWTNLKNLKIYEEIKEKLEIYYIGYNSKKQCLPHEDFDIPYFHSSEYKKFRNDLSDSNGEWRLRIRSIGKADVMQCEEWVILTAADDGVGATKSKLYYNKHNGGIMKKNEKLDVVKCDVIVKQLKDGVFPINEVDKETHRNMDEFQPRSQTYPEWITEIKDEINFIGGNITYTDPTIVFEGLGENGKDKAGGGIHTKYGVLDSKATKIKEQRVPSEIGKALTSSEIRYICNQFNKRPRKRSKYINSETVVKEIVDGYIEDKIEPDDPIWPVVVRKHGFIRVKTILEDAKDEVDEIKQAEEMRKAGQVRKRYDVTKNKGGCKEELDEILDAINYSLDPNTDEKTKSTTFAIGFSTGNIKTVPIPIIDELMERAEDGIETKKILLHPHHTKTKHRALWKNEKRDVLFNRLNFIFPDILIDDTDLKEHDYNTPK